MSKRNENNNLDEFLFACRSGRLVVIWPKAEDEARRDLRLRGKKEILSMLMKNASNWISLGSEMMREGALTGKVKCPAFNFQFENRRRYIAFFRFKGRWFIKSLKNDREESLGHGLMNEDQCALLMTRVKGDVDETKH